MEGALILVHARGLMRAQYGAPRLLLDQIGVGSMMVSGLIGAMFIDRAAFCPGAWALPIWALGSTWIQRRLLHPVRNQQPVLPLSPHSSSVAEVANTVLIMAPTLAAYGVLLACMPIDEGARAGATIAAARILLLGLPFLLATTTIGRQQGWDPIKPLLLPSIILLLAWALGVLNGWVGTLVTATVLWVQVPTCLRADWSSRASFLKAHPSRRSAAVMSRSALPAAARLHRDLLRGLLLVGLPATAVAATCWLAMGLLEIGIGDGLAATLLILTAQFAQMLAMMYWPWLPYEQASQGWEAHRFLPVTRARLERTAFTHLAAMLCLFAVSSTVAVGWVAAGLDMSPGEVLDDTALLAPFLPPMLWLFAYIHRFHKGRRRQATYALAGTAFWAVWLLVGLVLMVRLPIALLPTCADTLEQTLALGATQILLAAIFFGSVLLLRLTWLRPIRRSA